MNLKGLTLHTALTAATMQLTQLTHARLEAEILLSHLLNVSRSYLYAWSDKTLSAKEYAHFQHLINRRLQGEPIAYLTGYKEFWSLQLQVTDKTLIPRPETELLVEQALMRLPNNNHFKIIDLGTGSGAIALAIAKERPHCHVLATDYSPATLAVAQHNAQRLGIDNVEFIISHWCENLGTNQATVIVSNPPYIAAHDPHLLQGDVRYEPRQALVADENGLADLRQIITQATAHLVKNGWLLVEHGYHQAEAVRQLFQQQHYTVIATYPDLARLARVTVGQKNDVA